MLYRNWESVPNGVCLVRMFHENFQKHVLHLHLKRDNSPWYDQPHVPAALSQECTADSHREFWEWAENNLPIYDYPTPVKSAYA